MLKLRKPILAAPHLADLHGKASFTVIRVKFLNEIKQLNSFILSNLYLAPVGFYIRHVLIDKQSNRMASAINSVQAFTFEPILQNFIHVISLPLTKYSILLLQATSFKNLASFRG